MGERISKLINLPKCECDFNFFTQKDGYENVLQYSYNSYVLLFSLSNDFT